MNTVTIQISATRYEVRTPNEHGQVVGIFTTIHDAVAFSQAYSLGRY